MNYSYGAALPVELQKNLIFFIKLKKKFSQFGSAVWPAIANM